MSAVLKMREEAFIHKAVQNHAALHDVLHIPGCLACKANKSSLSLATAYLTAASQKEASEGNLLRRSDPSLPFHLSGDFRHFPTVSARFAVRRNELEAAKNQSTQLASVWTLAWLGMLGMPASVIKKL